MQEEAALSDFRFTPENTKFYKVRHREGECTVDEKLLSSNNMKNISNELESTKQKLISSQLKNYQLLSRLKEKDSLIESLIQQVELLKNLNINLLNQIAESKESSTMKVLPLKSKRKSRSKQKKKRAASSYSKVLRESERIGSLELNKIKIEEFVKREKKGFATSEMLRKNLIKNYTKKQQPILQKVARKEAKTSEFKPTFDNIKTPKYSKKRVLKGRNIIRSMTSSDFIKDRIIGTSATLEDGKSTGMTLYADWPERIQGKHIPRKISCERVSKLIPQASKRDRLKSDTVGSASGKKSRLKRERR